jgi:hypothetical protein
LHAGYNTTYLSGIGNATTAIKHYGAAPSVTFTRPTATTLSLSVQDVVDADYPYYFVYAIANGTKFPNPVKVVAKNSITISKPRLSSLETATYTMTLTNEELGGNLSTGTMLSFLIVGSDSSDPSTANLSQNPTLLEAPSSTSVSEPENTTKVEPSASSVSTFGSGGGGGCLLSDF